jgi:hypothetical protein
MSNYRERLKQARLPERTVDVCLRGDLLAEWEALDRRLRRQTEDTDSMEGPDNSALIERVRELEAEMSEHTDTFRLRAMPKFKFRKLVADHPPRLDEAENPVREDAVLGVNRDTMLPALIRASVVEPELDEEDWKALLDEDEGILTDRQFGDLADTAWFLNRGEVDVPFSHAASLARRTSAGE